MIDGRVLEGLLDEVAARVAAKLELPPAVAPAEPWRLLSVDEVAAVLGRSPRQVHEYVTKAGLPYVHLDSGGGRMFDPDDVRAWARGRRVPAGDV